MAGSVNWELTHLKKTTPHEAYFTDDEKRALLRFARESILYTLKTGGKLPADHFEHEATPSLRQPMGCFVTLNRKDDHALRGCIGEITARLPLYQAVTELAVQSAFADPRFPKLREKERDAITIEISALTPERPVDDWRNIVIGQHGMTINKHRRSAVFLPQVAPEQGWSREETLTQLALKAGLAPDDWRQGARFSVFEAFVFNETDNAE